MVPISATRHSQDYHSIVLTWVYIYTENTDGGMCLSHRADATLATQLQPEPHLRQHPTSDLTDVIPRAAHRSCLIQTS